jgi:hypothetical protein
VSFFRDGSSFLHGTRKAARFTLLAFFDGLCERIYMFSIAYRLLERLFARAACNRERRCRVLVDIGFNRRNTALP